MYFEEYGDNKNPTIIFLHGAMAFHSLVRQQELSDRFHLIFIPFRDTAWTLKGTLTEASYLGK